MGVNWIRVGGVRGKWCAVVNTVMNRSVPDNVCNFLTSCKNIGIL